MSGASSQWGRGCFSVLKDKQDTPEPSPGQQRDKQDRRNGMVEMTEASHTVWTLDLETSIKNKGDDAVGKFAASPFSNENDIVCMGVKEESQEKVAVYDPREGSGKTAPLTAILGLPRGSLLVGQNIKFDLLYLMRYKHFREQLWPNIHVWDTMLAEYLLTGQSSQYISLDKLATKYGGTLKDNRISLYWKANIDTEDIPKDELHEYLKNDVLNTELVYQQQSANARKLGMLPLIRSQMDALLATTEMEWNGMRFDKPTADKFADACDSQLKGIETECLHYLHSAELFNPYYIAKHFNIGSAADVACALFGGDYNYTIKRNSVYPDGTPVRYKSGARKGELKQENVVKVKHTDGWNMTPKPEYQTNTGKIGVSSDVLKDVNQREFSGGSMSGFIGCVLKHRELTKDLNTYYIGYGDLTWADGKIHHTLTHVATDTGRLSCSKPNLQNATQTEDH